ncbi:MAG TPA: Gfo/Idh/MocA family oxidoreductase [Thermoleophilaceae bacterium]|nr:Gfo/Idh/MocA family oxidoreductase [Thermoleophilaceae bacterium]
MSSRGPEGEVAVPSLGVGMLGHGFIGKAHAHALHSVSYLAWPPPLAPRLVEVVGWRPDAVAEAARRYRFERATTDWRVLMEDPAIELFVNAGPNDLHAEPTLAALRAGKHVLCEKPLGRTAPESHELWQAAAAAGVVHMCGFNYRFVPAVRLARELIEGGELGEVHSFRGSYFQDWLANPDSPYLWRLDRQRAGSGALGDIGAHLIDLARFLVGEIAAVDGHVRTVVPERPGGLVDVDDTVEATLEFANGAGGSISASRLCHGRRNALGFEISGTRGSLAFDLERMNELWVHLDDSRPGLRAQGFRRVLVTEADHPYIEHWWPPGHVIGWGDIFVHEIRHLLAAIAGDGAVAPYGATFEDGYRAAEVCDAILRSGEQRSCQRIAYMDPVRAG